MGSPAGHSRGLGLFEPAQGSRRHHHSGREPSGGDAVKYPVRLALPQFTLDKTLYDRTFGD